MYELLYLCSVITEIIVITEIESKFRFWLEGRGEGAGERETEGVGCRESIGIFGCLCWVEQWFKEGERKRECEIKIREESSE